MKHVSLFEFTSLGMDAFQRVFTGSLDDGAINLSDPAIATPVPGTGSFSIQDFETTKDMAEAVLKALDGTNIYELLPHEGLWAWLTFVLREVLFVRDADGKWRVGEIHRWYPADPNDWQKGQRHLVRMPVLLLLSLGDNADHLLCGRPSILPEIREQLTSQQDMFSNAFQGVARALYYDDDRQALKRGAGGKSGGSPRRLAKVRQQLNVTWDLEDLEYGSIIERLPKEFDRYMPKLKTDSDLEPVRSRANV
jgi:hypothetical protein